MYGLLFKSFFKATQATNLTARKYLRSLSENALHYRPAEVRYLTGDDTHDDRIVQAFFDLSTSQIEISESANRLQEITDWSTPAHSYYSLRLPFQKNEYLRTKMIQFYNTNIRTGRILELMDYLAANVAYRYCVPAFDKNKSR